MQAILLPIHPQWIQKIVRGEKTVELRTKFPKDYVGWVYMYCTKAKNKHDQLKKEPEYSFSLDKDGIIKNKDYLGNGKVIGRFWCDKVGQISPRFDRDGDFEYYEICYKDIRDLVYGRDVEKETCLNDDQLDDYLGACNRGYAIHISKLEVFDKPRELTSFCKQCPVEQRLERYCCECKYFITKGTITLDDGSIHPRHICSNFLTKAPQNYCYIEISRNEL